MLTGFEVLAAELEQILEMKLYYGISFVMFSIKTTSWNKVLMQKSKTTYADFIRGRAAKYPSRT